MAGDKKATTITAVDSAAAAIWFLRKNVAAKGMHVIDERINIDIIVA